jgi:hypothetical protein
MGLYLTLEIVVSVLVILAAIKGVFVWIAHVDQNTQATERLTQSFDAFTEKIDTRLTNHETRISRLEGRQDAEGHE